ncbi:MDIS1-interacting receptor like kinase 1 [Sorghum bicolor]|uniref:Leucine-rich repeat-containing N-terminal plant-type domain-containing protein n=1 Tax=Sorghum bicolor TaxID=4558 RepID=A0A1B6PFJ0_SORBI|nr:MDIS1-interacting receptor like kinase 1 [Sorghum bicolor]KXG24450.2 hypothetical protein SORBI_3007G043750 [Sorghum bicolor]|eukprot:XP_002445071.1 MDIS1-interacting receptor like kinase 1 [Sorghum bicolor]
MKHAWGDPPALAAWTWTAATSAAGAHCRWPYVQCDSSSRVTTLKLVSVNITGPISDAIGVFSNLAKLDLSNNSIDRRPLEYNGLTGTIPTELGELSLLETLSLAYNSFDPGKLPTSFRNMTKLVRLWAGGCGLVGNFPSYVVIMKTELELLNLADNSLTGSLPPEVWSLNKLQFLIVATLPDT